MTSETKPTALDLAKAATTLRRYSIGDSVVVIKDGRRLEGMYVSHALRGSDHAFDASGHVVSAGSMTYARITVTYGVGRYATEISVWQQAAKNPGMPYLECSE